MWTMNIYLAGGAVRDLLLGRPLSDRDYLVTKATREEFQRAFPNAQEVGHTFPIFLVDKTEFSFPRSDSLANELRARDLTVNAQLLDENGELICHPNGLDDLKRRILRPASAYSMEEDPLRVFRAARFWSQLPDFTPHEELLEAMRSAACKDLLKNHIRRPNRPGDAQSARSACSRQLPAASIKDRLPVAVVFRAGIRANHPCRPSPLSRNKCSGAHLSGHGQTGRRCHLGLDGTVSRPGEIAHEYRKSPASLRT